MKKPLGLRMSGDTNRINGIGAWLLSVIQGDRPPLEVFVDKLSTKDLKSWIGELGDHPSTGDRCAAVLNNRRRTLSIMLINQRGDAVYDQDGQRIARLFKFRELQSDCRALFEAEDTIIIDL